MVTHYENIETLSAAAAECVCKVAEENIKTHGHFTLALSGGGTPRTLFEYLAGEPYRDRMPWKETHIFWVDDRYVPANHDDSNVKMAQDTLLDHISIPAGNIHPIPMELVSPEASAEAYEATLRELWNVFDPCSNSENFPVFDFILLGMGSDGHTASLFPDSPVLDEQNRWVVGTPVPNLNPPVRRVTLTFPVINAAKHILFLVSGRGKQDILQAIQDEPEQAREQYPAARVNPSSGELLWFVV